MGTFLFYKCFANNIMSALENNNNKKMHFMLALKLNPDGCLEFIVQYI